MSDQDRLSHARQVEGLHSEPKALDSQAQSNPDFNKVAEGGERGSSLPGRNSEMIEKDGSRHDMRPPKDMSRDQDSQTFNKAWTGEQRAAARINELRARYGVKQQTDGQPDHERQSHKPGQRM